MHIKQRDLLELDVSGCGLGRGKLRHAGRLLRLPVLVVEIRGAGEKGNPVFSLIDIVI